MEQIVIIDDDPANTVSLQWLLEAHGYRVRCAGSVEQGVTLIRAARPSVAILDQDLPDGVGSTIVRAVTGIAEFHAPIFISLSGKALNAASEAHYSVVMRKPARPDALLDAVRIANQEWKDANSITDNQALPP